MNRPERRLPGPELLLVLALVALASCSGATPAPSGAAIASPSPIAPGSLGPPASVTPGATPLVRIDPALLAVLPSSVDGHSVLESGEGDAGASSNASLAVVADAAVGALAIDPGSGNFVLAYVVRLKPGAFDDAGFRNWRDSFDAGVCGGNGVSGHAETQIGGRQVYVATCGGTAPLHTYHAWIQGSDLLISVSSGGAANYGELLLGALRP